jgi:hypothetical protein
LVIRKRRASVDAELQAERDFYESMLTTVDAKGKRVISDSTEELDTLQPEHSADETRKPPSTSTGGYSRRDWKRIGNIKMLS